MQGRARALGSFAIVRARIMWFAQHTKSLTPRVKSVVQRTKTRASLRELVQRAKEYAKHSLR
jgi:hypothetical protein